MKESIYETYNPIANSKSIVQGEHYRFTLLTSRLIRAEYSEEGIFNDNQTQMALNRYFEAPEYTVFESEDGIEIVTEHVSVKYDRQPFSKEGLLFKLRGNYSAYHSDWYYGDPIYDLGGTAKTLDMIDGSTDLDHGVLSRYGFSVIDDSHSVDLTTDGWYEVRKHNNIDFYYFGYGNQYLECLADYYRLTGEQPLLPRYAFGNWWSRYYKYTADSYQKLIQRFQDEQIPFTVAVIDMDWHLVDIPEKYGSGWTGYTWNTDFFPDPSGFMHWLHEKGYKITLNVHPAEGIRPFEKIYREMAEHLGVDWQKEEFIVFDPSNYRFMEAYFKYAHHPQEKNGVDFWWIDWQQGAVSKGADPLWVLNHYHYHDIQKENQLGMTFSRYAGPGSHRYPIGFSGDSIVTWDSLDFQPYFTANASNIGYGWWSHDIGGHMMGYRDDELSLRWLQYGVFSPILRLHSSASPFLGKEPWNYREPYSSLMKDYLRMRHRLIPYLYTMNYRASVNLIPLIQPMYYYHAKNEEAYQVRNQYYFGSELLVMPMTKPINPTSLKSSFKGWLPEGIWYDFNQGIKYRGGNSLMIYRGIETIGLFAKEGAIIPLLPETLSDNSLGNPEQLIVNIYTGKDGHFTLIEDNGLVKDKIIYQTEFIYDDIGKKLIVRTESEQERHWILRFFGVKIIEVQGAELSCTRPTYSELNMTTRASDEAEILLKVEQLEYHELISDKIFEYLSQAQMEYNTKEKIWNIIQSSISITQKISELLVLQLEESVIGPVLEMLLHTL